MLGAAIASTPATHAHRLSVNCVKLPAMNSPSHHPVYIATSLRVFAIALLGSLASLAGCATRPTAGNPSIIAADQYAATFEAAVEALRRNGFVVDRQDFRFGRVNTQPKRSPTLLEFWSPDNTTFTEAAGSSLDAQRRVVTVRFDIASPSVRDNAGAVRDDVDARPITAADGEPPAPPDGSLTATARTVEGRPPTPSHYAVEVEVARQRLEHPRRRLTGSTVGHATLDTLDETPIELRRRGIDDPYWQTFARDPDLERLLLADVLQLADAIAAANRGEPAPDAPPPSTTPIR